MNIAVEYPDFALSKQEKAWLRQATRAAELSAAVHRHAAIVVRGGSVLGRGFNKNKNHHSCTGGRRNLSVHAEVDALSHVEDAAGATMYVARINKQGKAMLSRPCDSCYKAIKQAGVRRIVFTT